MFRQRLDVATNIFLIVACCVLVFFAAVDRFRSSANQPPPHVAPIGKQLHIAGVEWHESKSVVLVLSTTCHFCQESSPFYKRLSQAAVEKHVRLIAVFPQDAADAAAYIAREGLSLPEVHQSLLASIKVPGTPTLLIVNKSGTVVGGYVGLLTAQQETQIISAL